MINEIQGNNASKFLYGYVPNFYVVTAYYNPMGYVTRRKNYDVFAQTLRQSGIPLLTVECAFGDQPFTLPDSIDVVKIKSDSVIWQKERLLNLAISWLPKSCHYVAWLDCDLVFSNLSWAQDTVALLKESPVVQVFETCHRLPKDYHLAGSEGDVCESFALITPRDTDVLHTGRFDDHGHTGYGWAARRDILDEHGLYEHAIAGSADHYMAHAIYGDIDGLCVKKLMTDNPAMLRHFADWAEGFYKSVQGNLQVVPGQVMHLWHGDLENRKYYMRHMQFKEFDYNPYTDVIAVPGKPFELSVGRNKQKLTDWFTEYFTGRQEDGLLVAV